MKHLKKSMILGMVLILAMVLFAVPAAAKTYKLTVVAGHPPIFLWVSMAQDFFVPEVDKRLAAAGGEHKIEWNQAYGGTVAKIGGVLEAIEEGVADMGFVGTLFEAPKMPLHNVSYMTPFGASDIFKVVDTVSELQAKIPAFAQEWEKHNQVYLGGAGLDTYGILTNFPVKSVDDLNGHKIAAPGPAANWIKGTGAVAVAGNLNTYYNDIKTGVYEGTLTFMTAAAAGKLQEVAPHICMVNFGAQFAGGLSINKDVWESFPPEVQKIFREVGQEYAQKLAQAQTDRADKAMKAMEAGGGKVLYLSDEERKRWADKLPNVPMEWAKTMDEKGLPGTETVKGYLDGLRKRDAKLVRDWDK
jgi:TRAP-type C4-dicarboxylate transport system substrate-binding protein